MREILFRGKSEETQEWIYGDLLIDGPKDCSIREDHCIMRYDIIPESIGEFTGLTDKNGTKIFEGDIFRGVNTPKYKYVVKYDNDYGMWELFGDSGCGFFASNVEVIGNIHDNPELLGGENEC